MKQVPVLAGNGYWQWTHGPFTTVPFVSHLAADVPSSASFICINCL